MGQKISRAYGFLVKRPAQRFNVENRAHKVLDKIEDPKGPAMRAPMYQSDREILDKVREMRPELLTELKGKDESLDSRLKDVYVTSRDPPNAGTPSDDYGGQEPLRQVNKDRPLPLDRSMYEENLYPDTMKVNRTRTTRGKITIDEAVNLLSEHAMKPDVNTVQNLADKYRLNPETLSNAVRYFKVFKIHVPEVKERKEYDALSPGKDWVKTEKEVLQINLEWREERKKHKEMLKKKDAERKKLEQLAAGENKSSSNS